LLLPAFFLIIPIYHPSPSGFLSPQTTSTTTIFSNTINMRFRLSILAVLSIVAVSTLVAASGSGGFTKEASEPSSVKIFELPDFSTPGTDKNEAHSPTPTVRLSPGSNATYIYTLPTSSEAWATLRCETAWASPTFSEIDELLKLAAIPAKGWTKCRHFQDNGVGSYCKKVAHYKGDQISLCGEFQHGLACEGVVYAAKQVRDKCGQQEKSRAGGYFRSNKAKLRVAVH
ncbi:hypothetical protein BZA05DRAFT_468449, partial [Tricharina praecox]|uniref:uncharacterized protein n=1 Tax=Tricharina praecox TaxID=43433 RepID=UPI00221EFB4D